MTKMAYTYSVVRYMHDTAAGEMLNVGVIVYSPEARYLGFRLEQRFKRLSDAYATFDGDQYRRAIRQFEAAMSLIWRNLTEGLPGMFDVPNEIGTLVSKVWPDVDLSFRIGPTLAGIAHELEPVLESLFARMVLNQYERPVRTGRNDDDIWSCYQRRLPLGVRGALREKEVVTEDFQMRFPHAFKNGRWHLLQPMTFDYANASDIQEKAARWLGQETLLRENPEVGQLYLLLGAPRSEDKMQAYSKAKNILQKMRLNHRIIEENEADDFARYLEDYMREHGVTAELETPV